MNKYKFQLTESEKLDLADLLTNEINNKVNDNQQDYDSCLNFNRIIIEKELLQEIITFLLDKHNYILKYIDLTDISFSGLNVEYKNFSDTNANIDPQTVKDKSLFFTNLKNVDMRGKNFTGVNVRSANLEGTNANIDPQTVWQKSLKGTNLKNVDMNGKCFSCVEIDGANLEGTNANIDPQMVYWKSLKGTNLKNIDMSGKDFTGVNVIEVNLEGTNADINPRKVYNKSLKGTSLKNVDMSGKDFTRVIVEGANLEGTNAYIDLSTLPKIENPIHNTKLRGCTVYNVNGDYEELTEATIVHNHKRYKEAKQYIKSLFN